MKTSPRLDQIQILLGEREITSNLPIEEISRDLGQGVTLLRGQIGWGSCGERHVLLHIFIINVFLL